MQAARQCNKKAVKTLKKVGFTGGDVGPCFYMKKSTKGVVYAALHKNDYLMIGNTEAIDKSVKQHQKNGLVLKII